MFIAKIIRLIDRNLDNFKHWGFDFICEKFACNCANNNPVCKYVCYEVFI